MLLICSLIQINARATHRCHSAPIAEHAVVLLGSTARIALRSWLSWTDPAHSAEGGWPELAVFLVPRPQRAAKVSQPAFYCRGAGPTRVADAPSWPPDPTLPSPPSYSSAPPSDHIARQRITNSVLALQTDVWPATPIAAVRASAERLSIGCGKMGGRGVRIAEPPEFCLWEKSEPGDT